MIQEECGAKTTRRDYGKLYKEIFDIQNEYARIKTIDKKTEKQKEKLENLTTRLAETQKQDGRCRICDAVFI